MMMMMIMVMMRMKMMCHGVRNLRIQIKKVREHRTIRFGIWGSIVIIK